MAGPVSDDASTLPRHELDLLDTLPAADQQKTQPMQPAQELAFGLRLGRYLVLDTLGRGGMGIVYAAYDPVLDRRIALKLLLRDTDDIADSTAGRARMQREAQALARLTHANVITVHDVGERDGAMYIAMELVDGKTLRDWQRERPWREVLATYLAAARGLGAAHEAGLVHRDFKPDNVLVGNDGRVRVTDFGLARRAGDLPAEPAVAQPGAQSPSAFASDLTAAGAVMGTVAYMAVEQMDGERSDERSDQCSWCIAAWEAIYDEQPFAAGCLAVRSAAMKAELPKAPARANIPRTVERALARGMLPDAMQRWDNMATLVAAVERAMSSRRAVAVGGAVAGLAVIASVFAIGRAGASTDPPGVARPDCTTAGAPVRAVWTPAAYADVARAFAATSAPFAADAVVTVDRSIATWRTRWETVAIESCEATRIHGTQTTQMLDLRTACLTRKRDELATTVAVFAHADQKLVEAAPTLALPDLDACSDVAVLAGAVPPPRDAATRAAATAIEAQLEPIEAQVEAGTSIERGKQLVPLFDAQVAAAQKLGWSPLVARARIDLARVQFDLGHGKDARASLLAAAGDASAAGDPDVLVEVYVKLAEVEAKLTSEFAMADSWVGLAAGTLAHVGSRPNKQLAIQRERGTVADRAGNPELARDAFAAALPLARALGRGDELEALIDLGKADLALGEVKPAREHLERAKALARAEVGDKHPMFARIEQDLGTVEFREGKYPAAAERFASALAIQQAAYGPDSTEVAMSIEALGNVDVMLDRVDDAQRRFAQAIAILEARLGPGHPDVANAYNDIGGIYHRVGNYQRSLENSTKVLAMREKALGPDHPDVGQSLVNQAIEAKNLERWAIVDANYPRALAIYEKAYGKDSFEVAVLMINLGEARRAQGNLDAARVAYERTEAIFVKQLGPDHPMLAHVWNGLGQVELARHRYELAIPLLERAVATREKSPSDATDLAESRFALARALPPGDRARQLATAARDAYRGAGPGYAPRLAAVETWLR